MFSIILGEQNWYHSVLYIYYYRIIVCTTLDAHILSDARLSNSSLVKLRRDLIPALQENVNHLGMSPLDLDTPKSYHHWTHLIIDEAAQATEPETMIPLCVVYDPDFPVQIILCGDPHQLGSLLYSPISRKHGLDISFLERLIKRPHCFRDPFYGTHLKRNYRSHPCMIMMPSVLFYSDSLVPVSDKSEHVKYLQMDWIRPKCDTKPVAHLEKWQSGWPIVFVSVQGQDTHHFDQSSHLASWYNEQEADEIVKWVVYLTGTEGVSPKSMGIITPFRGQVTLIRKLLRKCRLGSVNVGSIDNYQGLEKSVILLSTVRSTAKHLPDDLDRGLGVICQPRHFNVAMTRAKSLQIVVGDPHMLMQDPLWYQYYHFCWRNGLMRGDALDPETLKNNGKHSSDGLFDGICFSQIECNCRI